MSLNRHLCLVQALFLLVAVLALDDVHPTRRSLETTTAVLEGWSLLQRESLYEQISKSGAFAPSSIQFMNPLAVERSTEQEGFSLETVWSWLSELDWNTQIYQRIFQSTDRLLIEHRIKQIDCRCAYLSCSKTTSISNTAFGSYPWVTLARPFPDFSSTRQPGCLDDPWTLLVAENGASSIYIRELDRTLQSTFGYFVNVSISEGASHFRDATGTANGESVFLTRTAGSLSDHVQIVDNFSREFGQIPIRGWFGRPTPKGSFHLTSEKAGSETAIQPREGQEAIVNMGGVNVVVARRSNESNVVRELQGVIFQANLEASLLAETARDLELEIGQNARVTDIILAVFTSLGLFGASKYLVSSTAKVCFEAPDRPRAGGWWTLLAVCVLLAIVDDLVVLVLLITEIQFASQSIARIGLHTVSMDYDAAFDFRASKEWVVFQRVRPQVHHVGTLAVIFPMLVILNFALLVLAARNAVKRRPKVV